MKKKTLICLLVVCLCFALSACMSGKGDSTLESSNGLQNSTLTSESLANGESEESQESLVESIVESLYESEKESQLESEGQTPQESEEQSSSPSDVEFPDVPLD